MAVRTHEGLRTTQGTLLPRASLVTAHTYLSWRQKAADWSETLLCSKLFHLNQVCFPDMGSLGFFPLSVSTDWWVNWPGGWARPPCPGLSPVGWSSLGSGRSSLWVAQTWDTAQLYSDTENTHIVRVLTWRWVSARGSTCPLFRAVPTERYTLNQQTLWHPCRKQTAEPATSSRSFTQSDTSKRLRKESRAEWVTCWRREWIKGSKSVLSSL